MLEQVTGGGSAIFQDLIRAQEPERLLPLLKEYGFTDEDISVATDTNVRSVRRWKNGTPGAVATERLGQLRSLVMVLRDSRGLTERGIVLWFRHSNNLLEGFKPLEVLGEGMFRSVREAALCFVDPQQRFTQEIPGPVIQRLNEVAAARAIATARRHLAAVS